MTKIRLGAALRSLRRKEGLTLSEISNRTGITVSTLSRVERDLTALTYVNIARLAQGLNVDISALFAPEALEAGVNQVTARRSIDLGADDSIVTTNYAHRYLNADLAGKKLVPVLVEHYARTLKDFGDWHRHPGEEVLFVVSGAVEVHTEFYEPVRLEVGQSIYIDSTMGHAYLAAAPGRCQSLCVMTAPAAHVDQALQVKHDNDAKTRGQPTRREVPSAARRPPKRARNKPTRSGKSAR